MLKAQEWSKDVEKEVIQETRNEPLEINGTERTILHLPLAACQYVSGVVPVLTALGHVLLTNLIEFVDVAIASFVIVVDSHTFR